MTHESVTFGLVCQSRFLFCKVLIKIMSVQRMILRR
ncbi:hypothetical protein FWK35_00000785, partial [Aphis craccivora]